MIRFKFIFLFLILAPTAYSYRCDVVSNYDLSIPSDETKFPEHLINIEEEKERLFACIEIGSNLLKDLKEQLYFHEVTALHELIELYDVKNDRLNNLYQSVKDQQTKDWQRFLDWQDKYHGKACSNYNEVFDQLAPVEVKNWFAKESDLKNIASLVPDSIDQDPVFKFWNSEREKDVKDFSEQCKIQAEQIKKFIDQVSIVKKHEEEVLSKI